MAYDEVLADRMRALLEHRSDVTEKKMFGGLAFLVGLPFLVLAAVGGVLAHYLLLRAGEIVAERGLLPAAVSLQLSTVVLTAVGLGLCWLLARRGPGVVR